MIYICSSDLVIAPPCITGSSLGNFQGNILTASDGANGDYFDNSVAMDGDTCVIGAYRTNSNAGSAYVYGSKTDSEPTGVCCVSSGCYSSTEVICSGFSGTWLGEGVHATTAHRTAEDHRRLGPLPVTHPYLEATTHRG